MRKIFIYGLHEEGNEDIRYIGKTNKENIKKRLNEHICESFRENEITHKRNWIKNVINNGGKINIKNIEVVDDENWEEREKYWISEILLKSYMNCIIIKYVIMIHMKKITKKLHFMQKTISHYMQLSNLEIFGKAKYQI